MPFTTEQFFEVFARYNQAIFPWQVIAMLAGVMAVALLWRDTRQATAGVLLVLAAMWLINGVGYHWLHFAPVNPVARLFAVVFVAEALLLVWAALARPDLRLRPGGDLVSILGLGCIGFAILIYPALGWLAGHRYPAVPMFGLASCCRPLGARSGGFWSSRGSGRRSAARPACCWGCRRTLGCWQR
jgi:peptidoglycan/LPS O-acetylase OafA/YrhL